MADTTFQFAAITEVVVKSRRGTFGMTPITMGHSTLACPKILPGTVVWTDAMEEWEDEDFDDVPWPCGGCIEVRTGNLLVGIDTFTNREGGAHVESPKATTTAPSTGEGAATEAEVIAAIRALPQGQKFTPDDVTIPLKRWATVWAKGYLDRVVAGTESPFAFMNDMCEAASKQRLGLTTGQAKGVLNTFRAGYWRTEMAKKDLTNESVATAATGVEIPNGKFTVVYGDGDRRTFQVKTQGPDKSFRPGETLVSWLNGPDNWSNYKAFGTLVGGEFRPFRSFADAERLIEGVRVLMADPRAAAGSYGIASGNCGLCGRTLTVPESIEAGIGPKCAAKAGW